MDKLKELQAKLKEGKITQDEYNKQLKALLDASTIDQDEYDAAEDFEAGDPGDKLIYSQNDLDRVVKKKANQDIRKALKNAGVDLDGVSNKQIPEKLVELAKAGLDKGGTADEKELGELRRKAEKADKLEAEKKGLSLENAVLKAAGKYNPVNPNQVVRALTDYSDLLDYFDDGVLDPKSVDKALKRITEVEPNLFKKPDGEGDDEDDQGTEDDFKGKPPGGAGSTNNKGNKKHEANKARAMEYLNLSKKD